MGFTGFIVIGFMGLAGYIGFIVFIGFKGREVLGFLVSRFS